MQSGDVLVAVNGRNVRGSSIQAVAQLILGPIGSSVILSPLQLGRINHAPTHYPPHPVSVISVINVCFQCQLVLRRNGIAFSVSASRKRPAPK